jgi:hypothetical protein
VLSHDSGMVRPAAWSPCRHALAWDCTNAPRRSVQHGIASAPPFQNFNSG